MSGAPILLPSIIGQSDFSKTLTDDNGLHNYGFGNIVEQLWLPNQTHSIPSLLQIKQSTVSSFMQTKNTDTKKSKSFIIRKSKKPFVSTYKKKKILRIKVPVAKDEIQNVAFIQLSAGEVRDLRSHNFDEDNIQNPEGKTKFIISMSKK